MRLRRLLRDREGSAIIEFSLIAPAFIMMILGIFQVAVWMQSYNALRNGAQEAARKISVEYQTNNRLSNSQIAQVGVATMTTTPYMLDQDAIEVTVENLDDQPFASAIGKEMVFVYQTPSFLSFAGIDGPQLNFTREIYVVA